LSPAGKDEGLQCIRRERIVSKLSIAMIGGISPEGKLK
jgi:hypothetical protein